MLDQQPISNDKLLEIIKIQTLIAEQGIDLGNIMNLVTAKSQEMTDAEGACVELIEKDELVYSATSGTANKSLGLRIKLAGSLSGKCLEAKTSLVSNDTETDERVNREACRKVGLRSMIVTPLIFKDTGVGVIKVFSSKADCFDGEKVEILKLMSGLIAAAMHSAIKNERSELFYRATHDSLTGIPNRSLFYDRLRQKLAPDSKERKTLGVVMIDMDGLKSINDNLGHRAGDAAIKEVGKRIKAAIREQDCLARLGGDEFGIITSTSLDSAEIEAMIKRIDEEIIKPFVFEDKDIKLRASMGYSILNEKEKEIDRIIEDLVEEADKAMYEVKRKRKKNKEI